MHSITSLRYVQRNANKSSSLTQNLTTGSTGYIFCINNIHYREA